MTDAVQIALIAAVPGAIFSAAALITSVRTHKVVNSRMSEMIEVVKAKARAEGKQEESDRRDKLK